MDPLFVQRFCSVILSCEDPRGAEFRRDARYERDGDQGCLVPARECRPHGACPRQRNNKKAIYSCRCESFERKSCDHRIIVKLFKDILYKSNIIDVAGTTNVAITSVTADSRAVEKDGLFVAVRGTQSD